MISRSLRTALAALAALVVAGPVLANHPQLKDPITGTPKLQSIDTIAFGPQGLLLIGDGAGGQVLAVDTKDTQPMKWSAGPIDGITEKLAGRVGLMAKDLEIRHLSVNPASGTAYFATFRQDTKKPLILTVNGEGKINEFTLEKVSFVRIPLPGVEKGTISKITDLAWANDRVLVAGRSNEEFGCKMLSIAAPLQNNAESTVSSAETYHVQHGRWETKAPMSALLPYEQNGKKYLVGAFSCTPLVMYPLDEIKPQAKVKGTSVAELGSGNQPLNMFLYEKGGKSYILMNTFRFHHKKQPFGPSPYWTARIERDLLGETQNVNEKAARRLGKDFKPVNERIQLVEAFHGVVHMDRLDADRALVIKEDGKGGMTLAAIDLP